MGDPGSIGYWSRSRPSRAAGPRPIDMRLSSRICSRLDAVELISFIRYVRQRLANLFLSAHEYYAILCTNLLSYRQRTNGEQLQGFSRFKDTFTFAVAEFFSTIPFHPFQTMC